VGEVLIDVLDERRFPASEIRPLASGRSAGRRVRIRDREVEVEEASAESLAGADLVFFAATGALSRELAPVAAGLGAVVIDKSNTWRMNDEVPLVVPEVNADAVHDHSGIIACPNCTTIGVVMALEPIRRAAGLRNVVVTTLQAASGAGRDGLEELVSQRQALAAEPGAALVPSVFAAPIENNVVPLCEDLLPDGYSTEEMKLLGESRKIMSLAELPISVTCVRVPVGVGHSATLLVETERPLSEVEAREALSKFPGVELVDDRESGTFPTPRDVAGRDEVLVGRVRENCAGKGLWLWEVSDNLRKGAATNAVQIAEVLLERRLLAT
jgi:aspartate-semialdehyde dehydrogenase